MGTSQARLEHVHYIYKLDIKSKSVFNVNQNVLLNKIWIYTSAFKRLIAINRI